MKSRQSSAVVKIPLTIGERILSLRIAADLNQTQLSKILGCSQANISKIEADATEPTMEQLSRMHHHFGISIDAFVEDQLDFKTIAIQHRNFKFTLEHLYIELGKLQTPEEE